MTLWSAREEHIATVRRTSWLLLVTSLGLLVATYWVEDARLPAAILFLSSFYGFNSLTALRHIQRLQAALDMKRYALDAMDKKQPLVVAGQTLTLGGEGAKLRARDGTEFIVKLKGIANDHVDVSLEFLG